MKKINQTDGRNLPREVQQHNRNQAIRLFQEGKSRTEITEIIQVHYDVLCKWIRAWKKGGKEAIKLKKRGRTLGENRKLTQQQEDKLKELLINKTPQQLNLPFALWNRKAIKAVIHQKWGIKIAIRTMSDDMKRWEFTPQKPLKRAYEQNPKAVQKWIDKTYPEIHKLAKRDDAEIYWGDETGIRNDCQHTRGYAPRGQTPVVDISYSRRKTL